MKIQSDVRRFMLAANQPLPLFPTVPTLEQRVLRAKLILEEALEQCEAMGVQVEFNRNIDKDETSYRFPLSEASLTYKEGESPDLAKVADGCIDQFYVTAGAALTFGINLDRAWDLVQEANMAKFGPGSYQRPDGKQMKPPGWVPPDADIADDIKRQVREGNGL